MTDTTTTIPADTSRAAGGALPLGPGTWELDAAHTLLGFTIRRLGLSKVRGHFSDVTAEVVVGATLEDSRVRATVAMTSVDTGNADRDAHLRTPELLDVERRPTMEFRSTAVRADGRGWAVDGELTIGGVTAPLTLALQVGEVNDFFDGTRHAPLELTGELRRSQFDLGFGPMGAMLGDVVALELDVELIEPAAS